MRIFVRFVNGQDAARVDALVSTITDAVVKSGLAIGEFSIHSGVEACARCGAGEPCDGANAANLFHNAANVAES